MFRASLGSSLFEEYAPRMGWKVRRVLEFDL